MKIVFFTHRYPPDIGGVERTVDMIARELVRLGHTVKVITETPGAATLHGPDGPDVEELLVPPLWPFTRLRYWRWMLRHRREFGESDALHFHDYGTFIHWFLPLWFIIRKPAYAMTFHGFDSWPIQWSDRMFRRIASWCMNVSYGSGSYLLRAYRHRIDHTYVGAPMRRSNMESHTLQDRFVFVGRLAGDTHIDTVVRCLRDAAEMCGIVCDLDLVGEGPLKEALAAMDGGNLRLRLHGAQADPAPYLARGRWVIATGLLSALDAFSFERLAILPGFTDLKRSYFASIPGVRDMALLEESPEALTALFLRLLAQPDAPEFTGRIGAAKRYADTLSWTAIARLYVEGYASRN